MKFNKIDKQKNSTFYIKKVFNNLLSSELNNCAFDIVLGFESSVSERVCTLKVIDDKKLWLRVNIGFVQRSMNSGACSFPLKLHYCAFFIVKYIRLLEQAKTGVPQSYFDGLVFLNCIEVLKASGTQSICSPLSSLEKEPKRCCCVRPVEISSAIHALNDLRMSAAPLLNKQDIAAITSLCNSLMLFSGLPEIAYVHSSIPVYALVHSLKMQRAILAGNPEASNEFPMLSMAPFDQIELLTAGDMVRVCVQSNNAFLTGVAVRLVAFFHLSHNPEFDNDCYDDLVNAMKLYIERSVAYYAKVGEAARGLLGDNSLAIRCALKNINWYLTMSGVDITTGNIHPIL